MKRLWPIVAGIAAFLLVIFGFKFYMDGRISEQKAGLRDLRTYERFWSVEAQKRIIEDNTLVIFGSSELRSIGTMENIGSFLNGEEMNIMTVGGGYFQSLSHAITLGALDEAITSRKVALFLSPQWFGESGVGGDEFSSRFSEDTLLEFLCNPKISDDLKSQILNRTIGLLSNSPTQKQRVEKYKEEFDNPYSMANLYTQIMRKFWNYRAEFNVFCQLDSISTSLPEYNLSELDYNAILEEATEQGKRECTNNDFGIYDDYWTTYVQARYENGEVTEKEQVYANSLEYYDLRLFLQVAEQLDVEVILVSIPVNGKWYAYEGQLCDTYYQNVAALASGYENVTFVDMTTYEDEAYFLQDVMHLGWKGWTRINEALYKEFTGKS